MKNTLFAASQFLSKLPPGEAPLFGDRQLGYGGRSAMAAFLNLTDFIPMVSGASFVSSYPLAAGMWWLKFYYQGKTLMIPSKPMQLKVSWSALNNAGMTTGNKIITVAGKRYKVRLITGAPDTEWDRLFYRVCGTSPVPADQKWDNLTVAELAMTNKTLCQDTAGSNPYLRGAVNDIVLSATISWTGTFSNIGWRPVLELIE